VHPLEATFETRFLSAPARMMDPAKAVKKYTRSAAGMKALAQDIRPPSMLAATVAYLLGSEVFGNESIPFSVRYSFIADRLLAVRQDATMQDLAAKRMPPEIRGIFENAVRFYIFSQARLGGQDSTVEGFDATLNMRSLQTCLTFVLEIHQIDCIAKRLKEEFISYQVLTLCIFGDGRGCELADLTSVSSTSALTFAKHTTLCFRNLNYSSFFEHFMPLDNPAFITDDNRALYLSKCLAHELTERMRILALNVMNAAFNKAEKFPISELVRILKFESQDSAIRCCARAGVVVHLAGSSDKSNAGFSYAQFHVTKTLSPEPHET